MENKIETENITKEKSIEKMNIFEKLLNIQNELSTVAKNLEVDMGKKSYKATGEADVLRAVKPLEFKYHVYSYPQNRQIIDKGVLENEQWDYQSKQRVVKKNMWLRIEVTYRFVNIDNPSDYIDIKSYGDGIDSQDKATGKGITYADKYALLKAYKIITGDDPDQSPSQDLTDFKSQNTQYYGGYENTGANTAPCVENEPIATNEPKIGEIETLTPEQTLYIYNLPDTFKQRICVKYNISDISQLGKNNATKLIAQIEERKAKRENK